jgi:small GTP-binding protein
LKIVILGDSGVGKTSCIVRATQDTFDQDSTTNTIGFSFQKMFKEVPDKGCLNLFIWDTAGQEMYRSMIKMYYRGVAVALVVYDVGDRASFDCIGDWLADVREK